MKIKLIGTGSIGAKRISASTLIDEQILVDMPNGIVKSLKKLGCDVLKIKVILITHLHGDHFFDIPFFMLEKFFYNSNEKTKIYCPKGTKTKVKQLFEIAFPGEYDKVRKFANVEFVEFKELKREKVLDSVYVDSKKVEHGKLKRAHGFIIEKGNKKIGFSGDSKLCKGVKEIVQQSDVCVVDMSLAENGNEAHMGLSDIRELCEKNPNKTIVTTHMHDFTREKAKNININNLIVPEDGYSIDI